MEEDIVRREIEHFISEKITEETEDPRVALEFTKDKDVDAEIERKKEELWIETITPEAERIAEEIIEEFKDKMRKIQRKLGEVV